MISVAIIEDNRLVREGIAEMLNDLPDVNVVLAATSLDTAKLKDVNPGWCCWTWIAGSEQPAPGGDGAAGDG